MPGQLTEEFKQQIADAKVIIKDRDRDLKLAVDFNSHLNAKLQELRNLTFFQWFKMRYL